MCAETASKARDTRPKEEHVLTWKVGEGAWGNSLDQMKRTATTTRGCQWSQEWGKRQVHSGFVGLVLYSYICHCTLCILWACILRNLYYIMPHTIHAHASLWIISPTMLRHFFKSVTKLLRYDRWSLTLSTHIIKAQHTVNANWTMCLLICFCSLSKVIQMMRKVINAMSSMIHNRISNVSFVELLFEFH